MTTGIRPSSFRPGASSGGVIATNVRSAPQFSNVVVPKRGVITYNPAAGAGLAPGLRSGSRRWVKMWGTSGVNKPK